MRAAQGLRECGQSPQDGHGLVAPFGQRRNAPERSLHGLAEHFGIKPFGQGVDRLDRGHFGEAFGVEHAIWVNHLAMAVPKLELAGDPAAGAKRQAFFDPLRIGEKENQQNVAGLVLDEHLIGRLRARPRRPMLDDDRLERHHGAYGRIGDLRPVSPVDRRMGQVEEDVDDAGLAAVLAEQAVEQLSGLRPDAGKARRRGEQGIEEGRPHLESGLGLES